MVNEDILGGLRSALARSQSIERAKLSFQNAGYQKEEIEEAVRALSQHPLERMQPKSRGKRIAVRKQLKASPSEQKRDFLSSKKSKKSISQPVQKQQIQPQTIQKIQSQVSNYGNFDQSGKIITVVLVTLLLVLVGMLASIFLFRDQLVEFFSGLFS